MIVPDPGNGKRNGEARLIFTYVSPFAPVGVFLWRTPAVSASMFPLQDIRVRRRARVRAVPVVRVHARSTGAPCPRARRPGSQHFFCCPVETVDNAVFLRGDNRELSRIQDRLVQNIRFRGVLRNLSRVKKSVSGTGVGIPAGGLDLRFLI